MTRTVASNQPPPRYEIVHEEGAEMCEVVIYLDTHTAETEDDVVYTSRVLRLTVAWEPELLQDVRDRYSMWLALAKKEGE